MRRLLIAFGLVIAAVAVPLDGALAQETTSSSQASSQTETGGFFWRLWRAYLDEFNPPPAADEPEPARRSMPSPWSSPPFPSSEYQGYPLIGAPYSTKEWPLQKALSGTSFGDWLKSNRIYAYGWVTASGNLSSSRSSNLPDSYWLVANAPLLDQAIFRVERPVDTVQTDHVDVGFRSTLLYGSDYRFITAGGWFSDQLLKHNQLYGFDPTEQYVDVYIPSVAQGTVVRVRPLDRHPGYRNAVRAG